MIDREQVKILCVDDERNVLRSLERLFIDDDYEILTASSGDEGLETINENAPVQIIISDYRIAGMDGVDFLRKVCEQWPDTVRIVLSGYADTAAVVSAINEGQIYKFIPKPWNDDELKVNISNAVERYYLHKENIHLANELRGKNEELRQVNENLERLIAERTSELIFQNKVLKNAQNMLDAMPVGVIGIDKEGMIVQHNRKGAEYFAQNRGNILGSDRKSILSQEINHFIEKVMENETDSERIVIDDTDMEIKGKLMRHSNGQEEVVLVFDEMHTHNRIFRSWEV